MTIFDSDVEPLSKYSPVMLHLSPATRILNENPEWFKADPSAAEQVPETNNSNWTFFFQYLLIITLNNYIYNTTEKKHFNNTQLLNYYRAKRHYKKVQQGNEIIRS